MREILTTNDAVLLSFAQSVLADAGVFVMVADQHLSAVEGSVSIFPRRLLVGRDQWQAARQALSDAGLAKELVAEA